MAGTSRDGRTALFPHEVDLHTRSVRRMVLHRAALESVIAGATARLWIPQPDGRALRAVIHRVKSRSGQSHTLEGEIEGEPQKSIVQLVYHDGILHGSVARYHLGQHLEYRIDASGHLLVRELDPLSMTSDCTAAPEGEPSADGVRPGVAVAPEPPDGDTPGYVTIDLVVGYDREARIADGGVSQMEARILASVDRMNLAFANSQITNTEVMLLGTIEDPDYVFPGAVNGSMSTDDELGNLDQTTGTNPALNTVSDYANRLGADLKAFVIKQADGSAGIAYRPGTSSVTARDYMTSTRITFAHELGHNIGLRHSWGDTSGSDSATTVHSFGWRLAPAGATRVRTIMAYDWGWGNGERIPYYANPNVTFLGARTGQVDGYNATGDALSDSRYVSGGLIDSAGNGFNGTNPSLGARNAHYLLAQAPNRASVRVRASFQVVSPAPASLVEPGGVLTVSWNGGDHTNVATVSLYRGGVWHSELASGVAGFRRSLGWTVPVATPAGTNYMVRVSLNDGTTADSGLFTISGPAPQTIQFAPIPDQSATSTVALSATGGASGNPVTFAVISGPAVLGAGDILSFTGAGSVSVTASQAGNVDYQPATPVTRTFQVTQALAPIVLSGLSHVYDGNPKSPSFVTTPPGLPVTITYNGSATPPSQAGDYALQATVQHALYQGAAQAVFAIAKAPQAIQFPPIADQPANATLALSAIGGGSIRPVRFTVTAGPAILSGGTSLSFTGAGNVAVAADQDGDANHDAAASVTRSFQVARVPAVVQLSNLQQAYNGTPRSVTAVTVPSALPVSVTYDGSATPPVAVGSYAVAATVDTSIYFGSAQATLIIDKAPQSILAPFFPDQFATSVLRLTATGGASGNPVIFAVDEGPAVLEGTQDLRFTGPGTVRVTINQAGDATHFPAPQLVRTFQVNRAPTVVTLGSLAQAPDGGPRPVSVTTQPAGVQVQVTYDGSEDPPTAPGTYQVVATVTDPLRQGSATAQLFLDARIGKEISGPETSAVDAPSWNAPWNPSASGLYDGLIRQGDEILGALGPLHVGASPADSSRGGAFSGVVRLLGRSFPIKGSLDGQGSFSGAFPQRDGSVLQVVLGLQTTADSGHVLRGVVSHGSVVGVMRLAQAPFTRLRPVPAALATAGPYTVLLPSAPGWGDDEPGGDGWATGVLGSDGVFRLTGRLGDSTPVTRVGYLSQDGVIHVYVGLYPGLAGAGRIAGQLTFRPLAAPGFDLDGHLSWTKPPDTRDPVREKLYPAGFSLTVQALGLEFSPTRYSGRILGLTPDVSNAEFTMVWPALPPPDLPEPALNRVISWSPDSRFVHYGPDLLAASVQTRSGSMTGSLKRPSDLRPIPFSGAVLQHGDRGIGGGVFVHGNRTGAVRILPGVGFREPGDEGAGAWLPLSLPGSPAPLVDPASLAGPSAEAAGTYAGWITDPDGQAAGTFEAGTLSAGGALTATVWASGVRHSLRTSLGSGVELHRPAPPSDGFLLGGSLSLGGVSYTLNAYRIPPAAPSQPRSHQGAYTLVFHAPPGPTPSGAPDGDGFGTLTVGSAGFVAGLFDLPDGTKLTLSGPLVPGADPVSAPGAAIWSFHRPVPGTRPAGFVAGSVAFRSLPGVSDLDGSWRWSRPATSVTPDFDLERPVLGARYQAPALGQAAFPGLADSSHNVWLRFVGGADLSTSSELDLRALDRVATWTNGNRLIHYGPQRVSLVFNPRTGLLRGSFADAPRGISVRLGGVLLQIPGEEAPGVRGSYQGASGTGWFGVSRRLRP
jgi:hypothetical protein